MAEPCEKCGGLGVMPERDEWGFGKPCPACKGTGKAKKPRGGGSR